MIDPEIGVGAYQISGGASGGFLGAKGILDLIFGYMGLFLDISKVNSASEAMSKLIGGLAKGANILGTLISMIFKTIELFQKCGGFSSIGFWIMLTMNISLLFVSASLFISSGGLLGVAFQSIISSAINIIQDFAFNIVSKDAGCK